MPSSMPIVAVPADLQLVKDARWHASPETYLAAAARVAGVVPVVVPALAGDFAVEDVLARVDGVLVSGAVSNVHPSRYGVEPSARHEPYDRDRDALTAALIAGAIRRGLPLLAICRGLQELNVVAGGTLATEIQEIEGRMDHRSPEHPDRDVRYGIRQDVTVCGAKLRALLDTDAIRVNSLHRQAIDRLGDGLTVEARAPDGTVEAVSVDAAAGFAFGVQWHPEYFVESDATSAALFRAFGEACRAFRTKTAGSAVQRRAEQSQA